MKSKETIQLIVKTIESRIIKYTLCDRSVQLGSLSFMNIIGNIHSYFFIFFHFSKLLLVTYFTNLVFFKNILFY